MLEAVPAERLRLGTTCIGATEDGHALFEGADSVVADIVVGADGIRSTVRRSLFGDERLRYGGHRAWRAGTRFDDERVRDPFVESGASAAASVSACRTGPRVLVLLRGSASAREPRKRSRMPRCWRRASREAAAPRTPFAPTSVVACGVRVP
jgi:2-polyprenyl-6-methoxyphenol hydroxylase-like FAD-dependent oxidoreductase